MTRRRERTGFVGLSADLMDESKRFADARWPYPLERNARGAGGAVWEGPDRSGRIERHGRGFVWAILDDGMDQAEQEDRDEITGLRRQVVELQQAVDELATRRARPRVQGRQARPGSSAGHA